MKIVLASALFPPDIAPPAPYIKELAARLAPRHEVTAVVYGRLPEEVPGARIVPVDKRRMLPVRLAAYFFALWRAARGADILFIENGASVELPALLASARRAAVVLHKGDVNALGTHPFLERLLARRAARILQENPPERPEILPLRERPQKALNAWEDEWRSHVAKLERIFADAQ